MLLECIALTLPQCTAEAHGGWTQEGQPTTEARVGGCLDVSEHIVWEGAGDLPVCYVAPELAGVALVESGHVLIRGATSTEAERVRVTGMEMLEGWHQLPLMRST